jgi:hypothetical protein
MSRYRSVVDTSEQVIQISTDAKSDPEELKRMIRTKAPQKPSSGLAKLSLQELNAAGNLKENIVSHNKQMKLNNKNYANRTND